MRSYLESTIRRWAPAALLLASGALPASAQPAHVMYQGSLFTAGSPFTGNADFKFVIVDGDSVTTLWSNDGTSVGGAEPTASVSLTVDVGIFTVLLGQGMTPLTADDLAGSTDPRLRVWVDTGGGFEQLSDQPLSSSPFALESESAKRAAGSFEVNDQLGVGGTSTTSRVYAASGFNYGVLSYGSVYGLYGIGGGTAVRGYTSWTGTVYGVRGQASYTGSSTNYGGHFTADGAYGRGVYGLATGTTNVNYGGWFESDGPTGRGVYGRADGTGGAIGVLGFASRSSGLNYGVYGSTSSSSGFGVYSADRFLATTNLSGSGDGWLHKMETTANLSAGFDLLRLEAGDFSSSNGYFLRARQGADYEFSVALDGEVRADGPVFAASHLTGSADFAEMLPAESGLEPGDVLVIDSGGELARCSRTVQASVAGVYSTDPGFVGGFTDDPAGKIPLAILGIVPVKVSAENGPIRAGDLLVTSAIPGHAMRHAQPPPGTILGKALQDHESGTGTIRALITLH